MANQTTAPRAADIAVEEDGFASRRSDGLDSAREANHRIANNLSLIAGLIRMQRCALAESEALSPAEVSAILGTVAARIDAIGLLHGLLARGGGAETMDLAGLVRAVCEPLVHSLAFPDQVELSFDLEPQCRATADQALPIALIVNEVVTNSLKYAHPTGVAGLLHVACAADGDGGVLIEVIDDGIGLPEDFDVTMDGGVGMKIIRSLSKQLRAEFAFTDKPIGLEFRLRVPASRGAAANPPSGARAG